MSGRMISPSGILRVADARDVDISNAGAATDLYLLRYEDATGELKLVDPSTDIHTQYLLATGTRTGATSQAQTFTNGVVTGDISPSSDGSTAIRLWNAAKSTASITVNTTSDITTIGGQLGVNVTPGTQRMAITGEAGDSSILHVLGTTDGYGMNATFTIDTEGSNGTAIRLVPTFNVDDAVTQHIALNNNVFLTGSDTVTTVVGQYLRPQTSAGQTVSVTNYYGLQVAPSVFASGTITNKYGYLFNDDSVASGNVRALWLLQNSGTNKYNIYASGTADNYLNGDTGIGVASPDAQLHVDGTVIFDNLPTSDPTNAGELWNDSGTLKISAG